MTEKSVILAEDDRVIRTAIADSLSAAGYDVRTAADGEKALRMHRCRKADLVILDVMMPVMDGISACEALRLEDPHVPVVFLTQLDSEEFEIRALGAGADNYILKTVSEELLLARIASALRVRPDRTAGKNFLFAGWEIDPSSLTMVSRDGSKEYLSGREADILGWFAAHPGEIFSRGFLLSKFWGDEYEGTDTALSMAIMRLRGKLASAGARIMSVRSCGYAYRPH